MMRFRAVAVLVVGVGALLAWIGVDSSSANLLCQSTTTPCEIGYLQGTTLDATMTTGTTGVLETTSGTVLDTCTGGTVQGKTTNTGSSTQPVIALIETLSFSGCSSTTDTLKAGRLEIQGILGTEDGALIGTEDTEVTVNTMVGSCVYGTGAALRLGTFKGGKSPSIQVDAIVSKTSGSINCPSHAHLKAAYTLTEPKPLYVEGGPSPTGTLLCKTTTTPCDSGYGKGTYLDASMTIGTTGVLKSSAGTVLDTCTGGTVRGTIENAGGGEGEEPVTGSIEILSFSGCTRETVTLKVGDFEIQHIAGTENGTLFGTNGTEVTVNTMFGTCVYGTGKAVVLGVLRGRPSPRIDINAVVPKISGNFACPSSAVLTAKNTLTDPVPLYVEGLEETPPPTETLLCRTTTTPCDAGFGEGTYLDASMTSGTSGVLETTGGTAIDTCTNGTFEGSIEKAGGGEEEEPVTGSIEILSFSACTRTTTVLRTGSFEVLRIAESENGKLTTGDNTEVEIDTIWGKCIYGSGENLDLGILKGRANPRIEINAVVPKISGNFACPVHAVLTASYTLTEPKPLYVEGAEGTPPPTDTLLCQTTTTPCDSGYGKGTVLDASITSGTTAVLESGETVLDTCSGGTVEGTTANAGGGEGEAPVTGTIETLSFSGCTRETTTIKPGGFEIQRIAGTENGTLILSGGAEVKINTMFGNCVYGSGEKLDLGVLKGGPNPTIAISTNVPKISGNFACPATALLTASYTLTEPKPLYVEGAT